MWDPIGLLGLLREKNFTFFYNTSTIYVFERKWGKLNSTNNDIKSEKKINKSNEEKQCVARRDSGRTRVSFPSSRYYSLGFLFSVSSVKCPPPAFVFGTSAFSIALNIQ
jgi:hypothetical protein